MTSEVQIVWCESQVDWLCVWFLLYSASLWPWFQATICCAIGVFLSHAMPGLHSLFVRGWPYENSNYFWSCPFTLPLLGGENCHGYPTDIHQAVLWQLFLNIIDVSTAILSSPHYAVRSKTCFVCVSVLLFHDCCRNSVEPHAIFVLCSIYVLSDCCALATVFFHVCSVFDFV